MTIRVIKIFLILLIVQPMWAQYDRDAFYIGAFWGRNLIHDYSQNPMELYIDSTNVLYYGPNDDEAHRFDSGSITMSDTSGEVSFVSNICHCWRPNGQLIQGTEEIFSLGARGAGSCAKGGPPGFRILIVLPIPGQSDIYYYIFTKVLNTPSQFLSDSLFYRVLDMTANNGKGQMLSEDHFVLADTAMDGSTMAATRHANGLDWWLTVSGTNNNTYVLRVDSQAIIPQDTFIWSEPYRQGLLGASQATFSPDGDKYARVSKFHGLSLADFDQTTGKLSNIYTLSYEEPDNFFAGSPGVAFSGNSRFLYVNPNTRQLIQYDMEADGLSAPDTLWEFSEENDLVYDEQLGWIVFYMQTLKLGKDCKIYSLPFSGLPFMHVVHNPNAKGAQALFRRADYRVPFPAGTSSGLGHHPHWRTATPQEDWCAEVYYDSIYTSVAEPIIILKSSDWEISPNPARDQITVTALDNRARPAEIALYDQQGRELQRWNYRGWDRQQYDLRNVRPGLYYLHIRTRDAQGRLQFPVVKKLVVQ